MSTNMWDQVRKLQKNKTVKYGIPMLVRFLM